MKQLFRFSTLLLALLLPITATAYDFEVDGIYYIIKYDGTVTVTYGDNRYTGDVVIPETVTHDGTIYTVTQIGSYAFDGCTGLTSVIIPNTVNKLWDYSFSGCSNLTSINMPNSVYYIGVGAFESCNGLASITVASDNPYFDSRENCNAIVETASNTLRLGCKNTIIPNSVTNIGIGAFVNCTGLTSINIPNSVTIISSCAFLECTGLKSIIIPNSVTEIDDDAFNGCSGLTGSLTIPNAVTYIGFNAFMGCSGLTSVTIGSSVTVICDFAFKECFNLDTLNFNAAYCNDFYSSADYSPFYKLNISTINIGDSVQRIPAYFADGLTGLTSLTIGNSVTTIGNYAFSHCLGLTRLTISNSVTTIGNNAFSYCYGLTSLTIGNSVTSIGNDAFYYCPNLHFLSWNAINCTSIGNNAFSISVSSLLFGDNVEHIPAGLPSLSMSGQVLKIPDSVKNIDASAIIGNCAGVTIGNGVENIASGTFSSGISVAYATTAEPQPCEAGAFANPLTLYVPAGSKMKYFTATGWSEFANIIEGDYIPASAVELDKDNIRLYKDASLQLTATILPNIASAISICWYSMNSDVASVSSNGMVYANAVGETDIIVWVDQVSDTCHVTVTPIMVEAITLSANHLSMSLDETYRLTASVTPENAENRILEWETPENEVLLTQLVNNTNMNIGAAGEGTVTITVRATDGSGVSASCEVFVSANTPVKTLTLSPETLNLYVGYSEQLNAIITPLDAYTQELHWFSSNENVVTVNSNGVVYGRGLGTATVTAITTDGSNLSATCQVTVTNVPVESVTLNYSELEMYEGNYTYLYANVQPSNAMNKTLQWASSNPRVATVTNNGRVNALEVGSTIITATSTDGTDITASCRVTVINHTANNCFYMDNCEVLHGDTVVVPVQLSNVENIMAFQTDVYLPTGFRIVTDEDDEFLITPSSRLTSDHVLMADRISDGAVRVICYTPQSKTINGNEGDLFYIALVAPENVSSDYAINLRNSRLTTSDYNELSIPDAGAVITVNSFIPGDVNDSHTVTVTDIVVTAQYLLGRNPSPFIFEAADMNGDDEVTVTDIMLIAYLINHPMMNAPKRMPVLEGCNDRMSGEEVTLMAGDTRKVSIQLNNEMDYTAFQLDLTLPAGLTASNFQLTDRAGSHAFDVNTLGNGKIRALCYSPAIEVIDGHEGALLTFDVTATDDIEGIITVDGIELVTVDCQTVLMNSFTIGVNSTTSVNELNGAKTVARVDYFNLAGQQIDRPGSGVTLVVTTYTDGTRSTTKVIK